MTMLKQFDGSRRHVLDWVATPKFLNTVRGWVGGQGLEIADDAAWMPKSWAEPRESKLFEDQGRFLPELIKTELRNWWLAHPGGANIPNWDLILSAKAHDGKPALVLVEAKAHEAEFDRKSKRKSEREDAKAQDRTDLNHTKIGKAIAEAGNALRLIHPGINISRDHCYQFSNRIAMAWKLASAGIPTALIFLGFTGDKEIAKEGYFRNEAHWREAFQHYAIPAFPLELISRDIDCGSASFRVMERSVPVERMSRPVVERRRAIAALTPRPLQNST